MCYICWRNLTNEKTRIPPIPPSRTKPMTPHRSPGSNDHNYRTSKVIPPTDTIPDAIRNHHYLPNHNTMVTGRHTRGNLPGNSHTKSNPGTTMGDNPIHRVRSTILLLLLLSILPQKTSTNCRNWYTMTPNRNYTI